MAAGSSFLGRRRRRRRLLLRLRPVADDLRLGDVGRVPRVVVHQVAVGVEHTAADVRRARRCAGLLDDLRAHRHVRIGHALRRDRARHLERGDLALDLPVLRRAVERDGQRGRAHERPDPEPVAGVVDELEIGVRIVDRGVAPERVVADVQRMVRPVGDREPGLVGGVERRRRDLADAAAEPRLQLAVDDHRRLEEALVLGALAGRRIERERLAGWDVVVVDQVRDELHVVDSVRHAAVEGLVGADEAGDAHGLRIARRPLGRRGHDREVALAVRRREERRHDVARRGFDIELAPCLRGDDADDVL